MNDKTEVFKPKHFILAPDRTIIIDESKTIGRSKADINIDDKKLSAKHCQFSFRGIQLSVKDLESTNGVYINGKKLEASEEVILKNGDELKLGSFSYYYYDSEEKIPTENKLRKKMKETDIKKLLLNSSNYRTFFEASRESRVLYIIWLAYYFLAFFFVVNSNTFHSDLSFLGKYLAGIHSPIFECLISFICAYIVINLHALWCYLKEPTMFQRLGGVVLAGIFLLTLSVEINKDIFVDIENYEKDYRSSIKDLNNKEFEWSKRYFTSNCQYYKALYKHLSPDDRLKLREANIKMWQAVTQKSGLVLVHHWSCLSDAQRKNESFKDQLINRQNLN
jgi:hypothetical protein